MIVTSYGTYTRRAKKVGQSESKKLNGRFSLADWFVSMTNQRQRQRILADDAVTVRRVRTVEKQSSPTTEFRFSVTNTFALLFPSKKTLISSPWPRKVTRRREPRSSRQSALNATQSKKEDLTSKVLIFTASTDVSLVLPTATLTLPLTRKVELPGKRIHFSSTLKTPRNTSRYVNFERYRPL